MDPARSPVASSARAAALALALSLLLALAASARGEGAPWQVGDRLEPFELEDAHGVPGRVDEAVRLVVFSADMDGGKVVQQALADPALQDLAGHRAAYVADVSRMPSLVTRLFALPSIRRRPYRTLLDPGPGPTARIPREPGKVTLFALDGLVVRSVALVDAPDAVAAAIRAAGAGGPEAQRFGAAAGAWIVCSTCPGVQALPASGSAPPPRALS